jgi:alpha-glucosidase
MPQLQNLGLSGYAWVGVDVGGFGGDATGELLTRWMEFGIFQPFCRNHSAMDTRRQEPWAFGEPYQSHIRDLLLLRQRLLPYLYTLFEHAHRTGAPILRPLLFEFPDDPTTYTTDDQFLFGPTLLIAPIARPGIEYRHVYLPRGVWVHYWSGEAIEGPKHVLAHAPLGQPAVYARANTPLPLWPAMAHVTAQPVDVLTWLVLIAGAEDGHAELYDDAGEGYAFEQGEFTRGSVACRVGGESIELSFETAGGSLPPPYAEVELDLRGLDRPTTVTVNGRPVDGWAYTERRLLARLPATAESRTVRIDFDFDFNVDVDVRGT